MNMSTTYNFPAGSSVISRFAVALVSIIALCPIAMAQVAITLDVQEVYDDNVFLENPDVELPSEFLELVMNDPDITEKDLESIDGEPNEDFMTVLTLSVSGAIPSGRYFNTGLQATVGGIVFAEQDDESRLILDSDLAIDSTDYLISRPWYIRLASHLDSQSSNIGVAQGSAARQAQSHTALAEIGITSWQFLPRWEFGADYTLKRYDFIEELTFSDSEDRLIEEEGSDYISNGLHMGVKREISSALSAKLSGSTKYIKFSEVETNDELSEGSDEQDRLNYDVDVGLQYEASHKVTVSVHAGFDASHYLDADTSVDPNKDEDQISLAFGGDLSYLVSLTTVILAGIEQSSGADSDGDRIVTRTISTNVSQKLFDRLSLTVGGRFLQFEDGDDLIDSTDRFELSAAINYAISQSIALSAGYNYANQNADDNTSSFLSPGSGDYESNRVFIGISSGLLGLRG